MKETTLEIELAKQALVDCIFESSQPSIQVASTGGANKVEIPLCFIGKFAELIINECLNEIRIECTNPYRNMEDSEEYGIIALKESIKRIKRRFGIEE